MTQAASCVESEGVNPFSVSVDVPSDPWASAMLKDGMLNKEMRICLLEGLYPRMESKWSRNEEFLDLH